MALLLTDGIPWWCCRNPSRKNKNPAPFRARGLGSFDLGVWCCLHEPDSCAWMAANNEYEYEYKQYYYFFFNFNNEKYLNY